MAANTEHPAFPQPIETDTPLWRYIDLPKLVLLLSRRAIFLSRLGTLQDPLEGQYTLAMRPRIEAGVRAILEGLPPDLVDFDAAMNGISRVTQELCFVSCWCLLEHESDALWRTYARQGVALRTTYERLAAAADESLMMGCVTYRDYAREDIPQGNALLPAMHKRRQYSHEHEVRLMAFAPPESMDGPPNGAGRQLNPHPAPGVLRPICPEAAVESVVVSPYASPVDEQAVRAVVAAISPDIRVENSEMMV